jgi:hypothetical protein
MPVSYGILTSILFGKYSDDPQRRLTGRWVNGDTFGVDFYIGNSASITLVPEPATLLLLGLGVPILSGLRRLSFT